MEEMTGTPDVETPVGDNQPAETAHDEVDILIEDESGEQTETPKDEQPAPRKLKVKIDGQELEVDEEEAARGYQRQSDYSRHMQRVQAEMQQAQQLRDSYQQRLELFIPDQEAKLVRLQQELQTLAVEDPAAWVAKQQEFQAELMRFQQANNERQQLAHEQETQRNQQSQALYQRAEQSLMDAIPEWKDASVRSAESVEVGTAIRSEVERFFGPETDRIMHEINSGHYGPLPIILARKALQYEKLMAKVAARKAAKSEQTDAPAPVTQVKHSGGVAKDPSRMTDTEFAAWRRRQIAQRN